MSLRMHVAEKYEVKYSLEAGFNNAGILFDELCDALNVEYYTNGDDYEVPEEEWDKLIDAIKGKDAIGVLESPCAVPDLADGLAEHYSKKAIDSAIKSLLYFDECADKRDGYVHLSYF